MFPRWAQTFEVLVIAHRRQIYLLHMETACLETVPERVGINVMTI